MSISTACRVEIPPTPISDAFLQALDDCFIKNGLHIGSEMAIANVDDGEVVFTDISERSRMAAKGELMEFGYELSVPDEHQTRDPFWFEVALHYEKDLQCRLIIVRIIFDSADRCLYDEHERFIARIFERVAFCLHEAFNATLTSALKSDSDDFLFKITGDRIERHSKLLADDMRNI